MLIGLGISRGPSYRVDSLYVILAIASNIGNEIYVGIQSDKSCHQLKNKLNSYSNFPLANS